VTSTAAPGTGRVELERRDDGWYLPTPETWPLVSVEHIVDGDTLDVRASGVTLRVRVYGINTTERGEACYSEGARRLAALAGREVRLVPDRRLQDSFHRELRYLFTPSGRSIDAVMVDEGVAHAWREDGTLRSMLIGLEDGAKAARRGCLWAAN
jgi:micrococcal nuclease